MKNKLTAKIAVMLSLLIFQVSSNAAPLSFDLTWSGVSFGNTATASGLIILDDAALLNPGNNDLISTPGYIVDFTITVANASSGNGTFLLAGFDEIIFQTDTALDLSEQLIGQPTSQDPWGTSQPGDTGGDFNIFNLGTSSAPTGTWYFELTTDNGSGDRMLMTSFAPSQVPLPAAFWLLLSGMAFLRIKFRR